MRTAPNRWEHSDVDDSDCDVLLLSAVVLGQLRVFALAVASAAFCGWLGYRIAKHRRTGAVFGFVVGLVLVGQAPLRQWYDGSDTLQPLLFINVPPDFNHDSVILIDDPGASSEVLWNDSNEGHIAASKSGVVRLKALGRLDNQVSFAELSNGKRNWELRNWSIHGQRILVYGFARSISTDPALNLTEDDELEAHVRQREAE